MRNPMPPATLDLLLLTKPLIDQLPTGRKRTALQQAWINSMTYEAAAMLDLGEGRLPTSTRGATLALIRLSLQLAKADGMDGVALLAFFNDCADSGAICAPVSADQAVRGGYALLGVLQALRMAAGLPAESDGGQRGAA